MTENKIPTGNERLSLPCIQEADGAVQNITFLHMGFKGLIDIRGTPQESLINPYITVNGRLFSFKNLVWKRLNYWIPQFTAASDALKVTGTILAPIGERGFVYRLELMNKGSEPLSATAGLKGVWGSTWHCINEDKILNGTAHVYRSGWNNGIVFDFRSTASVFSFAPMLSAGGMMDFKYTERGIAYSITSQFTLLPGEGKSLDIFWGIGYEEVASATSAKEMLRQGYVRELDKTLKWLKRRSFRFDDPCIERLFHINLFFNFFYASGITLDSEEMVLVTSRSPRYYVSAAYWDRDSLLWSFPAVLLMDRAYARDMLDYVFTRQIKNVGVHSRYIDGTVLEPGFELDELCAPILALAGYVEATGDKTYLTEPYVQKGVRRILSLLMTKKHPVTDLFETFLQPTDDMHVHRYITYDNVLVWRILRDISVLYRGIWNTDETDRYAGLAVKVRKAVFECCVKPLPAANGGTEDHAPDKHDKKVFAWSVDLKGGFDIYDEPPGSLQLLPFYGFVDKRNQTFKNTVEAIRSRDYPYSFADSPISEIGCPHAPHPWVLSLANSLISGRVTESTGILHKIEMDNFVACESVDENTGKCTTGAAFATAAGFLAYSLHRAFYKNQSGDAAKV